MKGELLKELLSDLIHGEEQAKWHRKVFEERYKELKKKEDHDVSYYRMILKSTTAHSKEIEDFLKEKRIDLTLWKPVAEKIQKRCRYYETMIQAPELRKKIKLSRKRPIQRKSWSLQTMTAMLNAPKNEPALQQNMVQLEKMARDKASKSKNPEKYEEYETEERYIGNLFQWLGVFV